MSNKLTATQWMAINWLKYPDCDIKWTEIYSQSVDIEKEQLIEAYNKGVEDTLKSLKFVKKSSGEQYYNETYES